MIHEWFWNEELVISRKLYQQPSNLESRHLILVCTFYRFRYDVQYEIYRPCYKYLIDFLFPFPGSALGGIITFFISGFLCSIPVDGGWPFVFYVFGAVSLLCAVVLSLTIHDKPQLHPHISLAEVSYISENLAYEVTSDNKQQVCKLWMGMDSFEACSLAPYRPVLAASLDNAASDAKDWILTLDSYSYSNQ